MDFCRSIHFEAIHWISPEPVQVGDMKKKIKKGSLERRFDGITGKVSLERRYFDILVPVIEKGSTS